MRNGSTDHATHQGHRATATPRRGWRSPEAPLHATWPVCREGRAPKAPPRTLYCGTAPCAQSGGAARVFGLTPNPCVAGPLGLQQQTRAQHYYLSYAARDAASRQGAGWAESKLHGDNLLSMVAPLELALSPRTWARKAEAFARTRGGASAAQECSCPTPTIPHPAPLQRGRGGQAASQGASASCAPEAFRVRAGRKNQRESGLEHCDAQAGHPFPSHLRVASDAMGR